VSVRQLSAFEEILLGAASLHEDGLSVFTEWDLTVRVWESNRYRFGCRGYEELYPDHKRVMMDLMSKRKPLIQHGWIRKTRKNHYEISPLGLAEAARIRGGPRKTHERRAALYDALESFAFHRVFQAHLEDDEQPRSWLGVAAFLGLSDNDPDKLERTLHVIRSAAEEAIAWIEETDEDGIRRGDSGKEVSRERLSQILRFLSLLETRFDRQFAAIRSGSSSSR
jgi:DNA-binding PadR family transcriptional regulator